MARSDVHFEIFLKKSRKAAWVLIEAARDREPAIERAKALLAQHPEGSVRVSKETWIDAESVFRAIAIFEAGGEKFEDDGRADRKHDLPCVTPSDLSSLHARQLIARVLAEWLRRQGATVIDLLHRVDLVEKLEATGTEYQHAVQKVAIAQAGATSSSVQHYIKQINDLLKRAVEALYAETRAGAFQPIERDGWTTACAEAASSPEPERRLRGRIAASLKGASNWRAKIDRTLDLCDDACAGGASNALALKPLGEYLGELLAEPSGRAGLGGEDLGGQVGVWTDAFAGAAHTNPHASPAAARLARHFAQNRFDPARAALARAIVEALNSPKRMKPDDIEAEVALNRRVADTLIRTASPLLPAEDIIEAFVARSRRLLEPEAIEALANKGRDPAEGVAKLIALEDNIVGADNKVKLAAYVRGRLGAHAIETAIVYGDEPVLSRLSQLAALRRRLDESGFSEADKLSLRDRLDALAEAAEAKSRLIERLEAKAGGPIQAAHALLKLVDSGALPAGALSDAARRRAMKLLASPEARSALARADEAVLIQAREAAAWAQAAVARA